jgi:hypothetical protein
MRQSGRSEPMAEVTDLVMTLAGTVRLFDVNCGEFK